MRSKAVYCCCIEWRFMQPEASYRQVSHLWIGFALHLWHEAHLRWRLCTAAYSFSSSQNCEFQRKVFLNQGDGVFNHSHEWSVLSPDDQDQAQLDGLTQISADHFVTTNLQHGWVQCYCTVLGINMASDCVRKPMSSPKLSICACLSISFFLFIFFRYFR